MAASGTFVKNPEATWHKTGTNAIPTSWTVKTSPSTIDLSMVDNMGLARATRTTANCYLVHEAGSYKLPLVYGNAIKNGVVNEVAFYPGKDGSITNGTDRFVNHNDDGITGPWITKSGSDIDAGMGLTAASAELLWQDAAGLITSVFIEGDYLRFNVGTFNPGNAVIAVKDGSGNILWSWHIWATEDDLTDTSVIATGSHDYAVAPVNLGWVPTGGGGKQGYCPYYQWGRKDPLVPAAAYNSNTDHTVYDINSSSVTGFTFQSSTTATIGDNIKNPTRQYYNSSTTGNCNTTYYNMWDAQNSLASNVSTPTVKTIYDPCPPGFCVPTENMLNFMGDGGTRTMSTWDEINNVATWNIGVTGTELWFPIAGARPSNNGTISYVGTYAYLLSSTPNNTKKSYRLRITSSNWQWTTGARGAALSVRPVVEE